MSAAVKITREADAQGLRKLARLSGTNGRYASRLLAIANVVDGMSRSTAARQAGMDLQTLRDWVLRFNDEGIDGLRDRKRPGRRSRLSEAVRAQMVHRVTAGPDPEQDGIVRWRRVDLQSWLASDHQVVLHENSIGRLLRQLGFRRLSVRPQHPETDVEAQEALKKTLPQRSDPSSPTTRQASRLNSGSKMKLALGKKAR